MTNYADLLQSRNSNGIDLNDTYADKNVIRQLNR